ncbi:RING/U-box superfamily protein [Spatholobus suberectus]|nr:RING/U-box superfamily protein [Spatholobus suberectus]
MYSASTMKSMCKPPLPRSPMRLRPPHAIHSSNSTTLQTPPGSLTKSQKPVHSPNMRPEYRTISCELRSLAKMVRDEFSHANSENAATANSCGAKNPSSLFERGRFYDEYSARRNERLMRKKGITAVDEGKAKSVHALGVTVESGKKSSVRKIGNLRKSISAAYSAGVSETPRYMLRSMTKENKKPPLATKFDKAVTAGEKKMGTRVRRI